MLLTVAGTVPELGGETTHGMVLWPMALWENGHFVLTRCSEGAVRGV